MTIFVLNPNSNTAVTDGIATALGQCDTSRWSVSCITSREGPPGIETNEHVSQAAERLEGQLHELNDPSAVVVACFSDPGVTENAARFPFPIVGIRQAAITSALRIGEKFGVIAMSPKSIPRHMSAFAEMGVSDRIAGDRSVGLSISDMMDRQLALPRLTETALELRDADGADVLVLGCAGMPSYKPEIEDATGLPVVEPCHAGVALAMERLNCHPNFWTEPSNAE